MAIVGLLLESSLPGLPAGLLALGVGVVGDEARRKPGDSARIFERHRMRNAGQYRGLGIGQHAAEPGHRPGCEPGQLGAAATLDEERGLPDLPGLNRVVAAAPDRYAVECPSS
jgi:hypothetical protein